MNSEGLVDYDDRGSSPFSHPSTNTGADDLDQVSNFVNDTEALDTPRVRKRRFSTPDIPDHNTRYLPPQEPRALASSTPSSISHFPKHTASQRYSSSSNPEYISLNSDNKSNMEKGIKDFDRRPMVSAERGSMSISNNNANKGPGYKPQTKHLVDEKGKTWECVGMKEGQNGRMRRQFVLKEPKEPKETNVDDKHQKVDGGGGI